MKILLILLFTFSAHALIIVDVSNSVTGIKYGAKLKDVAKVVDWIDDNKSDNSWGKVGDYLICGKAPNLLDIVNDCANDDVEKAKKDADTINCSALKMKLLEYKNDKFTDLSLEELNMYARLKCL